MTYGQFLIICEWISFLVDYPHALGADSLSSWTAANTSVFSHSQQDSKRGFWLLPTSSYKSAHLCLLWNYPVWWSLQTEEKKWKVRHQTCFQIPSPFHVEAHRNWPPSYYISRWFLFAGHSPISIYTAVFWSRMKSWIGKEKKEDSHRDFRKVSKRKMCTLYNPLWQL